MSDTAILEVPVQQKQEYPAGQDADYHWTVDAFYKAYDAGAFGFSKRLELIQGRIVEKMPPGPHHSFLADAIAHMLRLALEPPLLVREEKAVHLAFDGELVPDVTVVRGKRADYGERHPLPDEVALLVEVADTSAPYDLGEKALQYAQAGILDYWVVLANEAAVVVHREPTPEGYRLVERLTGQETISPLAAPEAVWTVSALLGSKE